MSKVKSMDDYIREARSYALQFEASGFKQTSEFMYDLADYMASLPTVDAVPVVHGGWIPEEKMYRSPYALNYKCSVCKTPNHQTKFCPECGAKMVDSYSMKLLEAISEKMKKTGLTNEEMEGYFFGKKVKE